MASMDNLNQFSDLDALLNAVMEDLDDLPPMGVPPSGHYNLQVSYSLDTIGDENKQVIKAEYEVLAINELKDEQDRAEVAIGQKFTEYTHVTKKDGKPNSFGIGKLKQRLAPFVEPSGQKQIASIIEWTKDIVVAATVKRTVNKKNEDQFNMDLKDVVVL